MLESTRRPEVIMEVIIEHLGAVQFEIKARGHAIVSDQPRENGGFDEGMTPPELLLASLGSCAAFYAAQYLRKHKLATEGTRVRVTAEKEKNPPRIARFHVEIDMPAALDDTHRAGVQDAVHSCLIHNTLQHPPEIHFEFKCGTDAFVGETSAAFSNPR
jgi:putative redox protein